FPQTDAAAFGAIDKERIVQLIDVPLIEQQRIRWAVLPDFALFFPTPLAVLEISDAESKQRYGHRYGGHAHFRRMAIFGVRGVRDRKPLEARVEKMLEGIASAKPLWESDISGNDGSDRQDDQRHDHRLRRFMDMVFSMRVYPGLAKEGHEQEP